MTQTERNSPLSRFDKVESYDTLGSKNLYTIEPFEQATVIHSFIFSRNELSIHWFTYCVHVVTVARASNPDFYGNAL